MDVFFYIVVGFIVVLLFSCVLNILLLVSDKIRLVFEVIKNLFYKNDVFKKQTINENGLETSILYCKVGSNNMEYISAYVQSNVTDVIPDSITIGLNMMCFSTENLGVCKCYSGDTVVIYNGMLYVVDDECFEKIKSNEGFNNRK